MSFLHSSMDRCVKQFHGLEELTGRDGIMERKTGDDTGVTDRERDRGVVETRSGDGA